MTTYYHGGARGLRPGRHVLPPVETGVAGAIASLPRDHPLADEAEHVYRHDRVYLTTGLDAARLYAGLHPDGDHRRGGDVYECEPVGDVEPDLDWHGEPGGSVCAPRAVVLRVVATNVSRAPYRALLTLEGER